MRYMIRGISMALLTSAFINCANANDNSAVQATEITQAVSNTSRLARDVERDPQRHPQEILQFFDVKAGMTVLDLFSGGGYYSELLARVVGPTGKVIAHNNQAYLPFAKDDLAQRNYASRLPEVEVLIAEANDLTLPSSSLDRVFFVLGFHDMFYSDESWPEINKNKLISLLFQSVKEGGLVAIIDHHALPNADVSTGQALHRIAPERVIELMQQEGFVLAGRTAVLENADDPLDISVFDKRVQGKTSRFVLKFVKP